MKKVKEFYMLATFLAMVVLFSSSCKDKDDDPLLPDYVGTWVAIESLPTEAGTVQIKDIMTFTEKSFTDVGKLQVSTNYWIDLVSMKGTLSVNGNIMKFTVTEVGMSEFSEVTGFPTGVMETHSKGSAEFDSLLEEVGQPAIFESEYIVAGNKLTLKTDNNEDGDFEDEMEITVYTKQ